MNLPSGIYKFQWLTSFLVNSIHILRVCGFILLLSCQSDPIVITPPGGYEYETKSFQLNTANVFSIQGDQHTGHSPRLYAGNLPMRNTSFNAAILIRLLPEILDTHQICSADSVTKVNIKLISITPLAVEDDTSLTDTLIQLDSLHIYMISLSSLSEIKDEDAVVDTGYVEEISALIQGGIPLQIELKSHSLEFKLFDHDSTIISRWCENQEDVGIVVKYSPNIDELNDESAQYLEFISTDIASATSGPRLNLTYFVLEDSLFIENLYSIENIESSLTSLMQAYYIPDDSTNYWGTVYAINLLDELATVLEEPLQLDSISVSEDIITESQVNSEWELIQIDLELNSAVLDSIAGISFWFNNAAAFKSESDIVGDNWSDTDTTGTEGNGVLDWTDENSDGQWNYGEGEEWFDYGEDNCPDELEDGIIVDGLGGCEDSEDDSAYNAKGTEGNGLLDWTDEDEDDLWSEGDSGEEWWDWGTDGCPDSLEIGDNLCFAEQLNPEYIPGTDPNSDNYNTDPSGDDWDENDNSDGTEFNGIWDYEEFIDANGDDIYNDSEEFTDLNNDGNRDTEPFHDWGTDGLPASLTGDPDANGTEENGLYDFGEPFEDTGLDSLFSADEPGYNESGTEGNEEFDGEGEFLDCGEDNICDDNDESDNYIIDPNLDNWSTESEDSLKTEKNGVLDWIDSNEDGIWGEGEGEEWYDYGIDNIPDEQEPFLQSFVVQPQMGSNLFELDFDEHPNGKTFEVPDFTTGEVSLWISEINISDIPANLTVTLTIMMYSTTELKALNFQLIHEPFAWTETAMRTKQSSFHTIGEKLFEDLTLLPRAEYAVTSLENTIQINYADDLSASIDFDSLKAFLEIDELIFSHEYSKMVLFIDTSKTFLKDDGLFVNLITGSDSEDDFILTSAWVSASADLIEIPLGQAMQGFQNGSIGEYNGFVLTSEGSLYNYSHLTFLSDTADSARLPRIDLTFTR